jgi:hypothetical protein
VGRDDEDAHAGAKITRRRRSFGIGSGKVRASERGSCVGVTVVAVRGRTSEIRLSNEE